MDYESCFQSLKTLLDNYQNFSFIFLLYCHHSGLSLLFTVFYFYPPLLLSSQGFTLKRTGILFSEKMGSTENCLCWNKNRHLVSSLLLALLFSSLTQVRFMAEGTSYTTHRETLCFFWSELDFC